MARASRLTQAVLGKLREEIAGLPDGGRLPNEADLAAKLSVSRKTIRAAMALLEREGAVRRIRGKGTFPARGRRARHLFRQDPRKLGLPLQAAMFASPFYARTVEGLIDETLRRGCQVVLYGAESAADTAEAAFHLSSDPRIDGLLLMAVTDQEVLRDLAEEGGKPVCLIDHYSEAPGIDCVRTDSAKGSTVAVEHLHHLGHRRIGFLNADRPEVNPARLRGYAEALGTWGLESRPEWVIPAHASVAGGEEAAMRFAALPAADRPTGLVTFSEDIALGAARALLRFGLGIPRDVSLVATGGADPVLAVGVPELTAVRFDSSECGRAAVACLLERIERPGRESRNIMVPPLLRLGQSTASPGGRANGGG